MDKWLPPSPLFHDTAVHDINFRAKRRVEIKNVPLPDYLSEHGDDGVG